MNFPRSRTFFHILAGLLATLPGLTRAEVHLQIGLNFTGSTLHLNSENTPPNANGASGLEHYVDPTDSNVFWTNQEFVSATDVWSTQITAIRIVPEPTAAAFLGAAVLMFMLVQARGRR